jgi:hypothetical protein
MKVKYLINEWDLQYGEIYNVFSIEIDNKGWIKYYISSANMSDFFISSYNSDYFEIVDTTISKFWEYWVNQFWEVCIWPKEAFDIKDFWWKYSESDDSINNIIKFYYSVWKNDLFNM